jgi:tRNA pseudouridine32 synthase/23S rRNA pseudouridine746 synthase
MVASISREIIKISNPGDSIIFLDSDILVINKPSGLLSIQDGYDHSLPHLSTYYEQYIGKIWIIHRLDKDTSGVMLLGRNADSHRFFNEQFRDRSVSKLYHCLVLGQPEWNETKVDLPLRINADKLHRTRVDTVEGKPASTRFKVLKRYPDYALVECEIYTGYTHQIRAHLFSQGLHIIGESLYCSKSQRPDEKNSFGLNRLGLHSYSLSFPHPKTGRSLTFIAQYTSELQTLVF